MAKLQVLNHESHQELEIQLSGLRQLLDQKKRLECKELQMQKHREAIYWEKAAKEDILEAKTADFAPMERHYLEQQRRLNGNLKNSKSDDALSSSETRLVKESE